MKNDDGPQKIFLVVVEFLLVHEPGTIHVYVVQINRISDMRIVWNGISEKKQSWQDFLYQCVKDVKNMVKNSTDIYMGCVARLPSCLDWITGEQEKSNVSCLERLLYRCASKNGISISLLSYRDHENFIEMLHEFGLKINDK